MRKFLVSLGVLAADYSVSNCVCCCNDHDLDYYHDNGDPVNDVDNDRPVNPQDITNTAYQIVTAEELQKLINDTYTCSICINEYATKDEVVKTPCNHFFHKQCLNLWLAKSSICPNCRTHIKEPIENGVSGAMRIITTNETYQKYEDCSVLRISFL